MARGRRLGGITGCAAPDPGARAGVRGRARRARVSRIGRGIGWLSSTPRQVQAGAEGQAQATPARSVRAQSRVRARRDAHSADGPGDVDLGAALRRRRQPDLDHRRRQALRHQHAADQEQRRHLSVVAVHPAAGVALHANGLQVCAWQYVYGNSPVTEAYLGAARRQRRRRLPGYRRRERVRGQIHRRADLYRARCAS